MKLKTRKNGAEVAHDLKTMPLVVQAFEAYTIPDIGPIVIDEYHGKPYWENRYAEKYREERNKAGVPSNVWSMDSRTGAVSETVEATGSQELASSLAAHSTTKMMKKYSSATDLRRATKNCRSTNREPRQCNSSETPCL